jgi:hypothetical protein
VINKGIEQDREFIDATKEWCLVLSKDVFHSAPIDVHLCDEDLKTIRVVVPIR